MSKAGVLNPKVRHLDGVREPDIVLGQGLLMHTVPALRSINGRLDARAISKLFGITLAALARSIDRSEQAVHKTPDAQSLQPQLHIFERIAAMLLRLTGSPEGLRIWLNASNPELEGTTPIELVLTGEGQAIVGLLEAVLVGEPA